MRVLNLEHMNVFTKWLRLWWITSTYYMLDDYSLLTLNHDVTLIVNISLIYGWGWLELCEVNGACGGALNGSCDDAG